MNLQRYNKVIVAAASALIVLFNTLWPSQALGVTEDQVREWVNAATTLVGAFLVYRIPNRE